jgi:CRISPR-associated protein Cmr3
MSETSATFQFTYRILIQPLGLLYGSKGRFLSPENLVGRSGAHFPPDTPTLSGLLAAHYQGDRSYLDGLMLGGPFWARHRQPDNFYVPTPFHCLVQDGQVKHILHWQNDCWQPYPAIDDEAFNYRKLQHGTWISLEDWDKIRSVEQFQAAIKAQDLPKVETSPWEPVSHLHPRLRSSERRRSGPDDERGSLFLEYGIQLEPNACLVYLSNLKLPDGCYRFGGEGHMVQVKSEEIQSSEPIHQLLEKKLGSQFAIVCPGVWGSNRLSYRAPCRDKDTGALSWPDNPVQALLTQRPRPFRFRLGNQQNAEKEDIHQPNQPKLLSRGRYAVPAGSIYVVEKPLIPWLQWPEGALPNEGWFPTEGYSFKRWGSALALPL